MTFKVEITMANGDKFSFVAKTMKGTGSGREVMICDIQDIEALEEWERNNGGPHEMPILGCTGVKFTPSKR